MYTELIDVFSGVLLGFKCRPSNSVSNLDSGCQKCTKHLQLLAVRCTEDLWLEGIAERLIALQGATDYGQDEGGIVHRYNSCPSLSCYRQMRIRAGLA